MLVFVEISLSHLALNFSSQLSNPLFPAELVPPRVPKLGHRFNILLKNIPSLRERRHRARDAFLAQQMQRGIRRAVGVVVDIVRGGAVELVMRMKACHLDDAIELPVFNCGKPVPPMCR